MLRYVQNSQNFHIFHARLLCFIGQVLATKIFGELICDYKRFLRFTGKLSPPVKQILRILFEKGEGGGKKFYSST